MIDQQKPRFDSARNRVRTVSSSQSGPIEVSRPSAVLPKLKHHFIISAITALVGFALVAVGTESVKNPLQDISTKLQDSQAGMADGERKMDLSILEMYLQSYYGQTGTFPTYEQFASSEWRQTNMPDLTDTMLKPSEVQPPAQLASSPNSTLYWYVVSAENQACDGVAVLCKTYVLGSRLSDGTDYTIERSQ